MERRFSARAQVCFPVSAYLDGMRYDCRAVDVSSTGMVFHRAHGFARDETGGAAAFSLHLDGVSPIEALARSVWVKGSFEAVEFVVIDDADRLAIAEMLDQRSRMHEPLH